MTDIRTLRGVGPALAGMLREIGIETPQDLARAEPDTLTAVRGISAARAASLGAAARDWLDTLPGDEAQVGPVPQDAPGEEIETPELPGPVEVVPGGKKGGKKKKKKKKDKDGKKDKPKSAKKRKKKKKKKGD